MLVPSSLALPPTVSREKSGFEALQLRGFDARSTFRTVVPNIRYLVPPYHPGTRDTDEGHTPRPVRYRRTPRRGRDGRGVSGPRHAARPDRGGQGPAS